MTKSIKKKPTKKRSSKYEPKVKFEGTFEEMVGTSVKGAGTKKKERKQVKQIIQKVD